MRIDTTHARRMPLIATTAASAIGAFAAADFIGWTATSRQVAGGHLINVFAATDNPSDFILSVNREPGLAPSPSVIRTNSTGGFHQGAGSLGAFQPSGNQAWAALDSFLTVGGNFDAPTNAWTATSTYANSTWYVIVYSPASGFTTLNSFMHWANNPNTASIPDAAGWGGSPSPARSLATLETIRLPYLRVNGISYGASSAAAAAATYGYLVAQLYVAEFGFTPGGYRYIDWKQSATLQRSDGTKSSATFEFRIGRACAGDLNDDRAVDGSDLGALLNAWGPCSATCPADLNSDTVVDGADLGILLNAWGPCP